ncbi:hypothetical protein BBJ28_00001353 [Nothophytophthora sp. Chile5]|nr:hypothetical protein BBJ28_00001353 [Nothophytophthora sp. Chile5]
MRGDQRTDMSLMVWPPSPVLRGLQALRTFQGKTNAILELGKRLLQHEEEWKDKCAAFRDLQQLLAEFTLRQATRETDEQDGRAGGTASSDVAALFSPENVQALTQPFRATVMDLRSTVVKEACATLSQLAGTLGAVRCKILVRDVFPTLLDARGTSNKVRLRGYLCVDHSSKGSDHLLKSAKAKTTPPSEQGQQMRLEEQKFVQLQHDYSLLSAENASLLAKLETHAGEIRRLNDTLQLQNEDRSASEARDQETAASMAATHAEDITTQLEIQHKLAERVANQDDELDHLRQQHALAVTALVDQKQATTGNQNALKKQVSSLETSRSEAVAQCSEKDGRVAQLESDLAAVQEQLTSVASKLEAANADAGDQVTALVSERTALEARLSAQDAQLSALREQQSAAVAALDEEKRALASEVSSLETSRSEAVAQCSEKDGRVAQLESDLAAVQEQLTSVASKLEAANADAGDQVTALVSERTALEARLSAQDAQLSALREQQSAAVAALDEEKRALASEVSSLETSRSEIFVLLRNIDGRTTQLKMDLSAVQEQLRSVNFQLMAANADAGRYLTALKGELSLLRERLSEQEALLTTLREEQNRAVAAVEKRTLASKVALLENSRSETLAQFSEKNGHVAQLKSDVAAVQEQLGSVTSKLEAVSAGAMKQMAALTTEQSSLKERLSVQDMQLSALREKQNASVAALKVEVHSLASDVSILENSRAKTVAQYSEKDGRVSQLKSDLAVFRERLSSAVKEGNTLVEDATLVKQDATAESSPEDGSTKRRSFAIIYSLMLSGDCVL